MKLAILAFDDLNHPTRRAMKIVPDALAVREFKRMKTAREQVEGLNVVELWTADQGFVERYIASESPASIKKESKVKKSILGLFVAVVAMIGLGYTVQAQERYGSVTLYSTNHATALNGSAALTTTDVIDCRKAKDVALQIAIKPKTTAVDVKTFYFTPSVDGVTYATENYYGFICTPSGTAGTESVLCTNINTMGFGYLKLAYFTNASAAAGIVTNVSVKYSIKIQAP